MLTRSIASLRLCSPPAPALLPSSRGPALSPLLRLPRELLHLVLELLPLPALGRLASRPARHLAVAWVASPSGLRRLANHLNSAADSEARL